MLYSEVTYFQLKNTELRNMRFCVTENRKISFLKFINKNYMNKTELFRIVSAKYC